MKNLRGKAELLIRFYQMLCVPMLICTFSACLVFYQYGTLVFPFISWFKLITIVIFTWYMLSYRYQQLYYYYNMGISKSLLVTGTIFIDLLIFLSGLYLTALTH